MEGPSDPTHGERVRITTRLTLALSVMALLLIGGYGVRLVQSESDDLRAAVTHEVELLARSVRALLDGRAEAAAVEAMLQGIEPQVRVLRSPGPDDPVEARDAVAALEAGEPGAVRFSARWATRALLLADGRPVVLLRPLADLDQSLTALAREVAWMALSFVGLAAALGAILGRVYVRRPLDGLHAAMQAVRAGDLRSPAPIPRQDELGAVMHDFNVMLADLRDAETRLDAEREARTHLELQLRDVERLVTVGQLATGLAHEIGSPLQVLNGRARLLDAAAADPAKVRRHAGILVEQTDRIARIVEDLARLARGRQTRPLPVDVAAGARAILELLSHVARQQSVALELTAAPGTARAQVDPDQLQQVLLNLVRNALTFAPRDSTVEVHVGPGTLRPPEGGPATPAVRLAVSDAGPGVPPELRERVFEHFFTTRSGQGGHGLGLSVVRGIVVAHGGAVDIEASEVGACFAVRLPVAQEERA